MTEIFQQYINKTVVFQIRNPDLSPNYAYMLIKNNQSLLVNAHYFPWIIFDQANNEHGSMSKWAFNSEARGC
jgi:rhodanese-related sulfurtransferase